MRYVVLVLGLTMGWRYCYGKTERLALDMGIWKEAGWVVVLERSGSWDG